MRFDASQGLKAVLVLVLVSVLHSPQVVCSQTQLEPYRAVLDTLQLSRVENVDFHPEYGLLIADSRERTVWCISPEGRASFIHALGQGPGEYERLNSAKWGPGGTIYIAGNTRVVVYSQELEYLTWFDQLLPWDVAPTDTGHLYVAVRQGHDGPVVMIDPAADSTVAVTEWRDSEQLSGLPNMPVSMALLQWNRDKHLLFVCYRVDCLIEVIRGSEVINSFAIPSEHVQRVLQGMQRVNRNRGERGLGTVSVSLFSFSILEDGSLLVALGGELLLATPEGEVLRRAHYDPRKYQQFYAAPAGHVFAVNRETMQVECVLLSDLLPEAKGNGHQLP